jgi:hypothetical protein
MRIQAFALVLILAIATTEAAPARSEARITFDHPGQLGTAPGDLDVISYGTTPSGRYYLDVFAEPGQLETLRRAGLDIAVTWPDIRDKFQAMTGCSPDGPFRDFGYYFNYWEMRDTLYRLCARYPAITRLDSSMRSYQNRALYCLKVSDNPEVEEGEPQVFFNGATHAREPMGTHACVAFASLLCMKYGTDSLTTWLVNNREVYFVPVMNPDGYVYNSDSGGPSAYWRKNRNNEGPRTGPGIDLNRNYGFKWGYDDLGSSPNPASETYRGPSRWSEPEVSAIRDFEAAHQFRTGIDFHTYGQDNLYAWAYTGASAPEVALLQEIGDTFRVNNSYTSTGQWYSTLYSSNGVSLDWELADTLLNGAPKFTSYVITSELGINDFWYGWDNPPYVDAEVALQMPNCYYMTRLGGAYLERIGTVVNDTAAGNGNGQLDPGELANLWLVIRNRALHSIDSARSIVATLSCADTQVQLVNASVGFPDMPRRMASSNVLDQFQVRASPNITPGRNVGFRLDVTFSDHGVNVIQPLTFSAIVGNHPVSVTEQRPACRQALTVLANPCREKARFRSAGDAGMLCILDYSGRPVRALPAGAEVEWDGRDSHGRALPPGIYFARLEAAQSETRKFVFER